MKFTTKLYTLILGLLILPGIGKAQFDPGSLLDGGAEDASKYLQNYLEPAFLGFGFGMNGSWYNTAKPHKLLGFDITVSGTAASVPEPAEFFTFNNADYTNMQLIDGTSADVPTLFGPNLPADDLPMLGFYDDDGNEILQLSAPTGLGLAESSTPIISNNSVPSPMVQLGLGLIKNTEIKFRFVPSTEADLGDGQLLQADLLGIGVLHDVKQWIPGLSALPLDLSVFYGWTSASTTYVSDVDAGESLEVGFSSSNFQVVSSIKLAVLTPYVGIGFNSTKAHMKMLGNYETESGNVLTDPIDFETKGSGMNLRTGARLKLFILTIHAEYTFQKYGLFSAGVGLSIR